MKFFCHNQCFGGSSSVLLPVVAEYTYDAFGKLIASSGTMADAFAFRYSTKYFDAETGFYYYGYRYYSPALMRWLTRDPIGEAGGVNLYLAMGNSPDFRIDALGQKVIIQIDPNPSLRFYISEHDAQHYRAVTKSLGDCKFICTDDCKVKVTGHITLWIEMLDPSNSRWNELFPQYIGNVGMSDTSQHSLSFDTSSWNQGGRYELHPLDKSKFKWED